MKWGMMNYSCVCPQAADQYQKLLAVRANLSRLAYAGALICNIIRYISYNEKIWFIPVYLGSVPWK